MWKMKEMLSANCLQQYKNRPGEKVCKKNARHRDSKTAVASRLSYLLVYDIHRAFVTCKKAL